MKESPWEPSVARVLCALDLQTPAVTALGLASFIASRFEARLEALYVGSGASAFGGPKTQAGRVGELMSAHNSEQQLLAMVQSLAQPPPTTTHHALGTPASAILERAGKPGSALIVLGAQMRSELGWQFRDDVARDVATMAPCPTLTVHEQAGPSPIERILVPVDFSAVTASALAWGAAFASRFEAEMHVLHVATPKRSTKRGNHERAPSSNKPTDVVAELAKLTAGLGRRRVPVTSGVVLARDVVSGIADYGARNNCNLIVMGMHGSPKRPARLTRDVVSTLRNRMSIPLLTVRGSAVDDARAASGD